MIRFVSQKAFKRHGKICIFIVFVRSISTVRHNLQLDRRFVAPIDWNAKKRVFALPPRAALNHLIVRARLSQIVTSLSLYGPYADR